VEITQTMSLKRKTFSPRSNLISGLEQTQNHTEFKFRKRMRNVCSIVSMWAFLLSSCCAITIITVALNQDWFRKWESPLAISLFAGWAGGILFGIGLLSFLIGKPMRLGSALCGVLALVCAAVVIFYILPNF